MVETTMMCTAFDITITLCCGLTYTGRQLQTLLYR